MIIVISVLNQACHDHCFCNKQLLTITCAIYRWLWTQTHFYVVHTKHNKVGFNTLHYSCFQSIPLNHGLIWLNTTPVPLPLPTHVSTHTHVPNTPSLMFSPLWPHHPPMIPTQSSNPPTWFNPLYTQILYISLLFWHGSMSGRGPSYSSSVGYLTVVHWYFLCIFFLLLLALLLVPLLYLFTVRVFSRDLLRLVDFPSVYIGLAFLRLLLLILGTTHLDVIM